LRLNKKRLKTGLEVLKARCPVAALTEVPERSENGEEMKQAELFTTVNIK
jgi:hypothetical protein